MNEKVADVAYALRVDCVTIASPSFLLLSCGIIDSIYFYIVLRHCFYFIFVLNSIKSNVTKNTALYSV